MKKHVILLIVLFSTININAQDKKLQDTLPAITSINIDGDITINLIVNKGNRIEGTVPKDQMEYFKWSVVDGNTLVINVKKPLNMGDNKQLTPIKLNLYVSNLKDIKCKRGARILSDDTIECKQLTIDASRNSVLSFSIKCFDLTAHCSFGSVLTLRGFSEFSTLYSSYGAHINNMDLTTDSSTVNASTDSKVNVKANKKLLLSAKTNAVVTYKKNEAVISKTESLLGKVIEQD